MQVSNPYLHSVPSLRQQGYGSPQTTTSPGTTSSTCAMEQPIIWSSIGYHGPFPVGRQWSNSPMRPESGACGFGNPPLRGRIPQTRIPGLGRIETPDRAVVAGSHVACPSHPSWWSSRLPVQAVPVRPGGLAAWVCDTGRHQDRSNVNHQAVQCVRAARTPRILRGGLLERERRIGNRPPGRYTHARIAIRGPWDGAVRPTHASSGNRVRHGTETLRGTASAARNGL